MLEIHDLFPRGGENPFGQFFIGRSYLNMLTTEGVPVALSLIHI